MKHLIKFFAVLSSSVLLSCAVSPGKIPLRPDKITSEKIEVVLPKAERWELSNGLVVLYYFDDEVPIMTGRLYFPGGTLDDMSGIPGLAGATGAQLREGSVRGMSPDELDIYLDERAAAIESSIDKEYGSVSFSCLLEDFNAIFPLFSRVALEPAFDDERLQLWKRLADEGIQRRKDDPETIAALSFSYLLYGENSRIEPLLSRESIAKVTKERMREAHKFLVRPNGAYLALSGAVPIDQAKVAVEQAFGAWAKVEAPFPQFPEFKRSAAPGIYVVERDLNQATIIMGHEGPARHSSDFYAQNVFNRVYGHAGFGSILFREIRSRLGLAYSVYGSLLPQVGVGEFQIILGTRADAAIKSINRVLELTEDVRKSPPSEEDFKFASRAIENGFVFKFEDPSEAPNREAVLTLLEYPSDYDEKFLERSRAVSPEMVAAVGQRWVHPDQLIVVIVGNVSYDDLKRAYPGKRVCKLEFDTAPKLGDC